MFFINKFVLFIIYRIINVMYNLKQVIDIKKKYLVAYSGGLDSTVLLHKLFLLRESGSVRFIRAVHVNHGININAYDWEYHCVQQCKNWNIPLVLLNIFLNGKDNLEAELRYKRYNIMCKVLIKNEILLTAHHLDDQCESVLLALKRGSGLSGLSAIRDKMYFNNYHLVLRPFLAITRKELKFWAEFYNLTWVEDFSNNDIRYDRNFLRHKVIPIILKRWPFFSRSCFISAKHCKNEKYLLNYFIDIELKKYLFHDGSLNISSFFHMDFKLCHAILKRWIEYHNIKFFSRSFLNKLYDEVIMSSLDANPRLKIFQYEVRRYRNSIYLIKIHPSLENLILLWNRPWNIYYLPYSSGILLVDSKGFSLRKPNHNERVNIRFKVFGEYYIFGRKHKRKIKKLWQEFNIPPWMRNRIPLIFYNNIFISALGVFVTIDGYCNVNCWKISMRLNK
ncbi:tRNA lysidine(34) synthetase TilS [Candidatus Purcelliella pentastirinorum]|uniref:tRNA(Ile)-lysidine synthase n=1 Tax=Candidatus Purcelliella pentastirinorum TaxID=472834 RepID=A0AAX3N7L0_9ENTR|nr:tRNA lysidine(34) synthetase TilS [Candidatus Purcelliella pentastirinorum]WDI78542.1 tRNA lysidine(34) synthetase TilS [Candidatus Purcelliella pentastirinorum]